MSQDNPQTLNKDVFESRFTWKLKNFNAMIDENLFKTTKLIAIRGLPFKWQLGIKNGVEWIYDYSVNRHVPLPIKHSSASVRFDLDFIEDGSAPEKYTKITCDFEMGSYWSGKAVLFPTKLRQTGWIRQLVLRANVNREGTLVLSGLLRVNAYFFDGNSSERTIEDERNGVIKLTKDIGSLLGNEKLSDVTIVVKDQEFKAHQLILAVRSPVFSLMLATEMKEKIERRIEIPDVSVEAVKEFLKFIYTGEASTTPHSKDLLSLAALYQIEDLKAICGRMLISQLNKDNAVDSLYIANLHNCEELKKKAFDVVTQQILREAIPGHLMNKPGAVEKLVIIKSKYDEVLQEATEA